MPWLPLGKVTYDETGPVFLRLESPLNVFRKEKVWTYFRNTRMIMLS